jgi:hypothetical protein
MKYGKALAAGVVGDIVMTVIMIMGRAMVMPANLEMILGITMGSPPTLMAWVTGLLIHLMAGGVFALIYAAGSNTGYTVRTGWSAWGSGSSTHSSPASWEVGGISYIGVVIFIGVLVAALLYEWRMGTLDWRARPRQGRSWSMRAAPFMSHDGRGAAEREHA